MSKPNVYSKIHVATHMLMHAIHEIIIPKLTFESVSTRNPCAINLKVKHTLVFLLLLWINGKYNVTKAKY